MWVCVIFLGDDLRIQGLFNSYDEANDHVVQNLTEDLMNVEIHEVSKIASEVV